MPETEQPSGPRPVVEASPTSEPSSLDLPPNLAAAIACIPLIGGVIFYILEKRNSFVRFYAMQSIIFGGAWLFFAFVYGIAHAILTPIPVAGVVFSVVLWLAWSLIGIAFLVVWIITTIKALMSVRWEIPYIGPIARKQAGI